MTSLERRHGSEDVRITSAMIAAGVYELKYGEGACLSDIAHNVFLVMAVEAAQEIAAQVNARAASTSLDT